MHTGSRLPVVLKIAPEASYCKYTGEYQPIAEKKRRKSSNGREEKLGQKV
jgi:hypothetical protein